MRAAVTIALVLGACGGGDDGAPELLASCPGGVRPAIADCYVGEFFADCGGTAAAPRLGCNDTDCLWFTGDCAPEGFRGSECSADNVCCETGWPFSEMATPTSDYDLGRKLHAFGTIPWDRLTEVALDVIVDPTLTGTATELTCSGPDPYPVGRTPCGTTNLVVSVDQRGSTAIATGIDGDPGVAGWTPWVEIVDDAGTPRARVCAARYTDAFGTCHDSDPICATSGTVTINQLPVVDIRQLVVGFDATFANGAVITGTLVGTL